MTRSGYDDDYGIDQWSMIMYRGAVLSATRGKRGQKFFKDLLEALDALPEKRLIAEELESSNGSVCAFGALGKARNIDMSNIDPENTFRVSKTFDIAESLSREVVYVNDEWGPHDQTPEQRFTRVRKWVVKQIKKETV